MTNELRAEVKKFQSDSKESIRKTIESLAQLEQEMDVKLENAIVKDEDINWFGSGSIAYVILETMKKFKSVSATIEEIKEDVDFITYELENPMNYLDEEETA